MRPRKRGEKATWSAMGEPSVLSLRSENKFVAANKPGLIEGSSEGE